MVKLRLKRKYLIIFTILITLISVKTMDLLIKTTIESTEKAVEECEQQFGHTCNDSELNYYFKNIK